MWKPIAVLVLLFCQIAAPARAGDVWWIDHQIAWCKSMKQGQRVLAVSSTGTSHCIFGYPASQEALARAEVVKLCNRRITGPARQAATCEVVWSNGKIIAPALYRAMTREFRVAVKIKSWDGLDKKEVDYDGFLVAGKSRVAAGGRLDNHARIILRDGSEICRGLISPVGVGVTFDFTMTCLGNLVLRGKGKVTGVIKIDGFWRYVDFDATIANPPHKMRVWTP